MIDIEQLWSSPAAPQLWTALVFCGVLFTTGVRAAFFPIGFARFFGVETDRLGVPYVQALGVRSIAMAALGIALIATATIVPLIWLFAAIAVVAAADALIAFRHAGSGAALKHLAGTVVSAGLAVWLSIG